MSVLQKQVCLLLLCAVTLVTGACSSFSFFGLGGDKEYKATLKSVAIARQSDSNKGRYVRVDMVYIYSMDFINNFLPKDGKGWFDDRATLVDRFQTQIEVKTYMPIPGDEIDDVYIPKKVKKVKKAMVYVAYYDLQAFFAFDVTKFKELTISLLAEKAAVSETNK